MVEKWFLVGLNRIYNWVRMSQARVQPSTGTLFEHGYDRGNGWLSLLIYGGGNSKVIMLLLPMVKINPERAVQ